MNQLVEALIYLRSNNVIHRDLKLANLFLKEDGSIKLGDFGLACKHDNPSKRRKSVCGTPNYIAPEMLSGDGHSFQVDVWAVGVLLYAMLMGKPPFETSNMKTTYNKIQSIMYTFPPDIPISLSSKILIQKILTRNPLKRPTLEELDESDFFQEFGAVKPKQQSESLQETNSLQPATISNPKPIPLLTQTSLSNSAKKEERDNKKEAITIDGAKDFKRTLTKKLVEETTSPKVPSQNPLEGQQFYKKLMSNELKDQRIIPPPQVTKNADVQQPLVVLDRKSIPLASQFSSGSKFEKKAFEKEKERENEREVGKEYVAKDQREVVIKESKELKEFRERREQREKETALRAARDKAEPHKQTPRDSLNIGISVRGYNESKSAAANIEKDAGESRTEPAEKDFEPAILKRIIHHMNNAQSQQESPEKELNSLVKRASYQSTLQKNVASATSISAAPQLQKQRSQQIASASARPLTGLVEQGASAMKDVQAVLTSSTLVANHDISVGNHNDTNASLTAPPRKINAFDILKKSNSKMNSMTNSMIADLPEAKGVATQPNGETKMSTPGKETTVKEDTSRRDRAEDKGKGERDLSTSSTTSNKKKLYFQRMISNEVNNAREVSVNESSVSPSKPEAAVTDRDAKLLNTLMNENGQSESGSNTGRARANSLKGGEVENKLIKHLLKEPNTNRNNEEAATDTGNSSTTRSSSAQPNLKVRPMWHQEEEEETNLEKPLDPEDYVKLYFDHSAKYGLVFIMHSGIFQILFNDLTKIMFHLHSE